MNNHVNIFLFHFNFFVTMNVLLLTSHFIFCLNTEKAGALIGQLLLVVIGPIRASPASTDHVIFLQYCHKCLSFS